MDFNFEECFDRITHKHTAAMKERLDEALSKSESIGTIVGTTSGITTGTALDIVYDIMNEYHKELMLFLSENYQRRN